jgi:hypothetical protein
MKGAIGIKMKTKKVQSLEGYSCDNPLSDRKMIARSFENTVQGVQPSGNTASPATTTTTYDMFFLFIPAAFTRKLFATVMH